MQLSKTGRLTCGSARAFPRRAGFHAAQPRRRLHVSSAIAAAKEGDLVAVHYTGTLDDGSVFDTSRQEGRQPLEFTIGAGKVIRGFDLAVTGLEEGGTRKVRLEPEDAYGQYNEEAVITFPADKAPQGLSTGDKVMLSNGMPATVKKADAEGVTIDLNHELAGKHLTFDVELMKLTSSDGLEYATFGSGCFWGPELRFARVPGVMRTEVGYSQGKVREPTYDQVCSGKTGHTEVVRVWYDPNQVTFGELLEVFWDNHDPTAVNRQGNDSGTQYRAGIYATTQEQLDAALEFKAAKQAALRGVKIATEVEMVENYNPAEDYHQQYLEKGGRNGRAQSAEKGCNDPIRCYG